MLHFIWLSHFFWHIFLHFIWHSFWHIYLAIWPSMTPFLTLSALDLRSIPARPKDYPHLASFDILKMCKPYHIPKKRMLSISVVRENRRLSPNQTNIQTKLTQLLMSPMFRHQGWVHAAFKGTHTVECQLQNLERLALQQFAARIIRQTPLVLENAVTGAANHSRFTKKHLATSHETANVMLQTNISRVKVRSGFSFYRQMIA